MKARTTSLVILGMLLASPAWAGNYTVNGDDTVTDNATGLVWQQADSAKIMTREQAQAYCANLTLAKGGWRLPNIKELLSLVDHTKNKHSIDRTIFPNTKPYPYWSSTVEASVPVSTWLVNVGSDAALKIARSSLKKGQEVNGYARCVRGGN